MATSKEKTNLILKEFANSGRIKDVKENIDNIVEEAKKNIEKERETIVIKKESLDSIDKEREEKKWKQSMRYYLLHPLEFTFGLKDFTQRKLKIF
ncbi:MAG: hypothetical protein ACFFHD_01760 [Promethearchaeota archaeon]